MLRAQFFCRAGNRNARDIRERQAARARKNRQRRDARAEGHECNRAKRNAVLGVRQLGESSAVRNATARASDRRACRLRSLANSTAGNCHMRENSTPSCAPGSRTSRVRPRESRSTAAAMRCFTPAGCFRAAGIKFTSPRFRAAHIAATGHSEHRGDFRRANRFAQLHHGLIPIARCLASQQRLRQGFELFPASGRSQIAANGVRDARARARHCHRALREANRTRCSALPRRCIGRFPATRESRRIRSGNFLRGARRFRAPLVADCARGCNSQARPKVAALPARARAPAIRNPESAPGIFRSRESRRRCASAAASLPRARRGRDDDRGATDARGDSRGTTRAAVVEMREEISLLEPCASRAIVAQCCSAGVRAGIRRANVEISAKDAGGRCSSRRASGMGMVVRPSDSLVGEISLVRCRQRRRRYQPRGCRRKWKELF